jgi:PPE family/Restriction endonuclease fold toxin 5
MVHPWQLGTPDVNYDLLAAGGTGPGTTLASAGAHGELAALLESVASSSVANMAGTYPHWTGVGGSAAQFAHGGMNGETVGLAAHVASKVAPLTAAAQAWPTAVAAMYPSPVVWANRANEHADQLINPLVWGALTPEIVALNLHYGHMWATNASAGASYGAALRTAAAALVVPAVPAVSGASPAAAAAAGAALAETGTLSGLQAGLAAGEQEAMAVISPAAAAPAAAVSAVSAVAATFTATPATSTATAPQAQPLAAVAVPAPAVPAPSQAPVPAASGMFAPPLAATITAPAPPTSTVSPPVAAPAIAAPAATPGVTSFIKPTDPFAAPPMAGKATSVAPGLLNAAALRGPISTMPLTTTATTTGSTGVRPMANVQVLPPPPQPAPSSQTLLQPGNIETLQPPPQPSPPTNPPAHLLAPPPSPQSGPEPSAGPHGPGTGGTGVQMLGSGPGGAPLAPPTPIPLNPTPPVPPPPAPGEPPLLPPQIPSWASPPIPKSVQDALTAYQNLLNAIDKHNLWRPDPHNWDQVQAYNQEAWTYNTWKADLEQQLNDSKAEYTPAQEAVRTDIPSWTQPAPKTTQPPTVSQGPGHWGPSGENFQGFSKQYQEFVTGHPISDAYFVNGTKFDDFADGALIDAKGDYGQFLLPNGDWKSFFPGDANFLSQAFRQTEAAGQIPVHWVFAQQQVAEKVAALLEANGYTNITVIWQPMG